jgi:hypothetical protein
MRVEVVEVIVLLVVTGVVTVPEAGTTALIGLEVVVPLAGTTIIGAGVVLRFRMRLKRPVRVGVVVV